MQSKTRRGRERTSNVLRLLHGGLIASWLLGCGGALDTPVTSGESHFLRRCEQTCADGLTCISQVCTRSCLVGKSSCQDLSKSATCTDQSIEPGMVAVCDQACNQAADCAPLGKGYVCDAGFCRGDAVVSGSGGSGNGGAGSGGSSPGGSSPGGSSPGGSSPGGAGSGGSSGGGSTVPAIVQCPADGGASDPIEVIRTRFRGNVIDLDVGHGGGCETHTYSLCYEPSFRESSPVQGTLRLLHDAHGDLCDAYLSASLHFDLTTLADYYNQSYGTTGGLIYTNYGTYAFGTLSCEQRTQAASAQAQQAATWTQTSLPAASSVMCTTAADCSWHSISTSCSLSCGAGIANNRADALSESLAAIDSAVCGDFSSACPALPIPPCAAPRLLACVDGACVEAP